MWKTYTPTRHLVLAAMLLAGIATRAAAQEADLLAVLRSDAPIEQKSAACRELARIGTKDAVPVLAAMLDDARLSHMARYALETIPDPSVEDALRDALGKVHGRPLLGVIGSLGVRRDAAAVDPLAGLLAGSDAEVAQSAARALGCIGTPAAAKALEGALAGSSGRTRLNVCEGLLRCAEARVAEGQEAAAVPIYDRLRSLADAPPQVRAAGLRGAILARGKEGVALLIPAVRGPDDALAAAAVRAAMESSAPEITDALVAALPDLPPERQGLLFGVLAARGDARVLPVVLQAAQGGDARLRILALSTLKRVGDATCVPALLDAAMGDHVEVAEAARDALERLPGNAVDEQIVEQLARADGKLRMMLIRLATERRTAAAAPAFWRAADDDDPAVRAAALAGLGAVLPPTDLPKLIARLDTTKAGPEAVALDEALQSLCLRAADREAAAAQVAAALPTAAAPVKARILQTLAVIGGATSLQTVVAAARSGDEGLRDAAFQVLGQWGSVDAAPHLLELHKATPEARFKTRAIRAYIRIARQFDMTAAERAAMCRAALQAADREEDKRLVLEILLRYADEEMQSIALEAAEDPALRDQAMLVVAAMASQGINRAELGRALARAGHQPVKLEIIKAEYGAGEVFKDVTAALRRYAKNYRIIFLPSTNYNENLGGDPVPNVAKQLKIKYRIDGKEGEVSLSENALIELPMPK